MSLNFGQSLFPSRNNFITSYDYFDVAEGIAYSVYYGATNVTTTLTNKVSTTKSGMIHNNGSQTTVANDDAYDQTHDIDFDIVFNQPKNIKGDILAVVPFGVNIFGTGTSATYTIKATLDIFHYDGSTETQLGSTITSEEAQSGSLSQGGVFSHTTTLKVNQATIKHFKSGETLRFTIKLFVQHGASGNRTIIMGVGCDPANRTDADIAILAGNDTEHQVIITNDTTQLSFHVPFKLSTSTIG